MILPRVAIILRLAAPRSPRSSLYSCSLATRNERSCFLYARRATGTLLPIIHSAAECKAASFSRSPMSRHLLRGSGYTRTVETFRGDGEWVRWSPGKNRWSVRSGGVYPGGKLPIFDGAFNEWGLEASVARFLPGFQECFLFTRFSYRGRDYRGNWTRSFLRILRLMTLFNAVFLVYAESTLFAGKLVELRRHRWIIASGVYTRSCVYIINTVGSSGISRAHSKSAPFKKVRNSSKNPRTKVNLSGY